MRTLRWRSLGHSFSPTRTLNSKVAADSRLTVDVPSLTVPGPLPCALLAASGRPRAKGVNRHGGKQAVAAHFAGFIERGFIERGSGARHFLLGNADQFTVGRGLPRSGALALPRGHASNLVHAAPGRTPAIAKTLDVPQLQSLRKAVDQARDDAYHVPQ